MAAIFLIKQLNTYLPEQMQTHFPFCFFCFSVSPIFPLILKVFAACFQSVSRFRASLWLWIQYYCKVFDAVWKTGLFKIVDSIKSLLNPSTQRLSGLLKFCSKEKPKYELIRPVSLWLRVKFWLSLFLCSKVLNCL